MLDLVIKGGTVVDGTGREGFRADVGVRDGRIVVIGSIDEPAARTIDADGRVVTPGFVDLHTHYDPQVMWDPAATPSSLHGVTSIFGGNCGFSIAPVTPEAADYLIPMLARVEGMPVESLEAGLDLAWDGFGSWLDRLEGNLAVNAGFMVGHSALRRVVMGDDAIGHEASPAQLEAMLALLHTSIEAGGMGFSSTASNSHSDHLGNPVPSRFATRDEFLALAAAAGQHAGTTLEFIASASATFTDDEIALMADMSAIAGRPLNWNGDGAVHDRLVQLAYDDPDLVVASLGGDILVIPDADTMTCATTWRSESQRAEFDACVAPVLDRRLVGQRVMAIVFDVLAHTNEARLVLVGHARVDPSSPLAPWQQLELAALLDARIASAAASVGESGATWADRIAYSDRGDLVATARARGWL